MGGPIKEVGNPKSKVKAHPWNFDIFEELSILLMYFLRNYQSFNIITFAWVNSVCLTFNPEIVIHFRNKINSREWKAHKCAHSLPRVKWNIRKGPKLFKKKKKLINTLSALGHHYLTLMLFIFFIHVKVLRSSPGWE